MKELFKKSIKQCPDAWILGIIFISLILSSCNHAKQAQKGFDKFIKHGGTIDTTIQTDTITRTIQGADGKDSLIYEIMYFKCPEITFPKSNVQIRQENKTERTAIRKDVVKVKAIAKNERKKANVTTRQEKRMSFFDWFMVVVSIVVGFFIGRMSKI